MFVQMGEMWLPQAFHGTMGTGIEGADEGSGGMGDRLFEEAGNGASGRREEEDHIKGHQV